MEATTRPAGSFRVRIRVSLSICMIINMRMHDLAWCREKRLRWVAGCTRLRLGLGPGLGLVLGRIRVRFRVTIRVRGDFVRHTHACKAGLSGQHQG